MSSSWASINLMKSPTGLSEPSAILTFARSLRLTTRRRWRLRMPIFAIAHVGACRRCVEGCDWVETAEAGRCAGLSWQRPPDHAGEDAALGYSKVGGRPAVAEFRSAVAANIHPPT